MPSEERNETNIWEGDLLDRQKEAMYVQRYLENVYSMDAKKDSSFVLNINSEWGHGKTWFLRRLAAELRKNYSVVYFDAWKNDFTKDALLSFVSVICEDLSQQFQDDSHVLGEIDKVKGWLSVIAKKAVPVVTAVVAKQLTGHSLEYFSEGEEVDGEFAKDITGLASGLAKIASSCAIEEFTAKRSAIDNFEKAISALVEAIEGDSRNLPIFIFVDELDRCKPTYAIELLECIKHLFGVAGVFFVIASDTRQLSHSVKAVYGQTFNSNTYLKRFFYAEYKLASPDYNKMAVFLFGGSSIDKKMFIPEPLNTDYGFIGIFSKTAEFFKLTARDQEQVFATLKNIVLTSGKHDIHYVLILLLVCLNLKFDVEFDHIFYHRNDTQLVEFFKRELVSGRLSRVFLKTQVLDFNGHGKDLDVNITSLFEHYFHLIAGDGDLNRKEIEEAYKLGPIYQQNIGRKLLENKNRDYRSGRYLEKHDLAGYFELLAQAGRITVG